MDSRIPNMSDHALIGLASQLPLNAPSPIISISPIILPMPSRITDLHLKLTLPVPNTNPSTPHPIILLSHGHGASNNLSSMHGYTPLANFWATHGFAVIQPTHLASKSLNLQSEKSPTDPLFWRSRITDMSTIIDRLPEIESSYPALLHGRLDHTRIAVAGHSLGGHTAGMLLGGTLLDPETNHSLINLSDPLIKAGILLAAPGNGNSGEGLSKMVVERFGFLKDYSLREVERAMLVVVGDCDDAPHLTSRGAEWYADGFWGSKGVQEGGEEKVLLTLFGGRHCLGGVSGFDAAEAREEESPERVAVVQRLSWAWLRARLCGEEEVWEEACRVFGGWRGWAEWRGSSCYRVYI
ncbi:alpha/beta-hydrolase [Aspergillus sclerotioniger CBS 115572]|uniref:Alpha/beta-hydrolase n=1 Tax=Aspergillus sclerotioniger CBS 115572 TaxID=1450535 RepID=A0A317WBV0_9EURO|nr:alpha/beta-hydrolase [Aspergillus sclerotioniger CBS 115572]PWY83241.1 alpha/beta-hydrolase [Aspergillus sclerotioniger CBS 115572]